MKKYKIQLNARAYRDLEEIFPSSHQERLVGNYAGKGYRQLLIDKYLAIFKIDEQRKIVKIITIQYQVRNL